MRPPLLVTMLCLALPTSLAAQDSNNPPIRPPVIAPPIMTVPAPPVPALVPLRDPSGRIIVQPLGSPGVPDYPARALRQDIEGRATYVLNVSSEGRIESCEIARTAGAMLLDDATCQFARRSFRFAPVRDEQGKPAAGIYRGTIVWAFDPDDERLIPKVVDYSYEYVVGADGSISDCRQMARMGEPDGFQPCDAPAWTVPLKNRLGQPVATWVRVTRTVEVEPFEVPLTPDDAIDYREAAQAVESGGGE